MYYYIDKKSNQIKGDYSTDECVYVKSIKHKLPSCNLKCMNKERNKSEVWEFCYYDHKHKRSSMCKYYDADLKSLVKPTFQEHILKLLKNERYFPNIQTTLNISKAYFIALLEKHKIILPTKYYSGDYFKMSQYYN